MVEQRTDRDTGVGPGRAPVSAWTSTSVRVGAIAVLLVLAVVAARARAAGYLPHVAGPPGPLVLGIIRSLGIGVVTTGLVLLAWGRRPRLRKVLGKKPGDKRKHTQQQRRRAVVAVMIGTTVALAYQIFLQLLGPPRQQKQQGGDNPDVPVGDGHGWVDLTHPRAPGQAGIGTFISVLIAVVVLVVLVVLLVRRGQMVQVLEDEDEDEDSEVEVVTRAMVAGQAAVRDEAILDARQAIVACFAAMERALAGVGGDVAPRAADTPGEVLSRGVAGARLPSQPADTLLTLFREARFSTHPMRQGDRDSADRALAEMLDALGISPERAR